MSLGITSSVQSFQLAQKDTAFLTLSGNQSSNLSAGNHIEFNTIVGNLALTTGSGQSNGKVTLLAGKTYWLQCGLVLDSGSAVNATFAWYTSAGVAIGLNNPVIGPSISTTGGWESLTVATYTPTVNTQVELRIVASPALTEITANGTFARIESVDAYTLVTSNVSSTYRIDTQAGFGSSDTYIPYFTNVRQNTGLTSNYTIINNSTNGLKITISNSGTYAVSFSWAGNGGSEYAGITLNSSNPSDLVYNITAATRLAMDFTNGGSGAMMSCAWTGDLVIGDVIRPQISALATGSAGRCSFTIARII